MRERKNDRKKIKRRKEKVSLGERAKQGREGIQAGGLQRVTDRCNR